MPGPPSGRDALAADADIIVVAKLRAEGAHAAVVIVATSRAGLSERAAAFSADAGEADVADVARDASVALASPGHATAGFLLEDEVEVALDIDAEAATRTVEAFGFDGPELAVRQGAVGVGRARPLLSNRWLRETHILVDVDALKCGLAVIGAGAALASGSREVASGDSDEASARQDEPSDH